MSIPTGVGVRRQRWQTWPRGRASGPAFDASTQIIRGPDVRWTFGATFIIPNAAVQEWINWIDAQDGGQLATMLGPRRFHGPTMQTHSAAVGFSDGSTFSDGSGFISVLDPPAPITVVGATSAWATSVTLKRRLRLPLTAADFPVGARLGLADRMYRIAGVTIDSRDEATVAIWPPLRADVADGAEVDPEPRLPMILANRDAGQIDDHSTGGVQLIDVAWIEDLSGVEVIDG